MWEGQRLVAHAPGRVELLGNHTDYNEGVVLGAAIDRGINVAGSCRDDGMIQIHSHGFGKVEIPLSELRPCNEARWVNYALGVVRELIDLGVQVTGFHAEVTGDAHVRTEESHAAARAPGVPALRAVMSADLARRSDLPDLVRRRAAHVVGENERVWRAVKLLEAGDGIGLGKLMSESHESSRQNFENSTPGLDLLVSIAQELPGVLGARLTGAGFGGATVTLCQRELAQEIATELSE